MRIDKEDNLKLSTDSDIVTPTEESDVPEDEEQSMIEEDGDRDTPAEEEEDLEWEAWNPWRLMDEIGWQKVDEMTVRSIEEVEERTKHLKWHWKERF